MGRERIFDQKILSLSTKKRIERKIRGLVARRSRHAVSAQQIRITTVARWQYRVTQVDSRMICAGAPMVNATCLGVRVANAHKGITHWGGIHKKKHRDLVCARHLVERPRLDRPGHAGA